MTREARAAHPIPCESRSNRPKRSTTNVKEDAAHQQMLIAIALSITAVIVALATRNEFMSGLERLQGLVAKLNETITTESAQQQAVVQSLRDQIAAGADAEAMNSTLDELAASIDRVSAIVPDTTQSTGDTGGASTGEEASGGTVAGDDSGNQLETGDDSSSGTGTEG